MTQKILIADDEPHMRRLAELSLRKGGYELVSARNGREAVELALRQLPDLIILDMSMPELDGLGALKELKQNAATQNIPVIMLTARGQELARQDAETSGASLFLTKPFSPSQLLAEVRRLSRPEAAKS